MPPLAKHHDDRDRPGREGERQGINLVSHNSQAGRLWLGGAWLARAKGGQVSGRFDSLGVTLDCDRFFSNFYRLSADYACAQYWLSKDKRGRLILN